MRFSHTLKTALALAAVLAFVLALPAGGEKKKKNKMRLAKEISKEFPVKEIEFSEPFRCQYREFVNYITLDEFEVYGIKVKAVRVDDKTLQVSWEGSEPRNIRKTTVVTVSSGEESHPICIYRHPVTGDWAYFSAVYRQAKLPKGTISFFDMDCDGKWFEPKVDAVMLGARSAVAPIMPVKWYYDWNLTDLEFTGSGKKMKLKAKLVPIKCYPDERAAMAVLNDFRMEMGLPLLPLDEELSRKCRIYAKFISMNGADMADWSIVQNPKPGHLGYTPECEEMKRSIFFCFDGAITAMEDLIGQFYHRTQFFFPDTKGFGIGEDGVVSVFNGEYLRDEEYMKWNYPIMIPAPEQTIRYYVYYGKYGGETPDPRPGGASCSFPISLQWENASHEIDDVKAKLFYVDKRKKKEVEVSSYCFWPKRPAHPTRPNNEGQILILGEKPFKRGARYHVTVEYTIDGKKEKQDWYFNTSKK